MKKLVMLFLATFIVVAGYSQTPSRCAPGDSSAKKCHGFGFQADITYNFIQLKPTEMKSFQVALMPGYHFCEYFFAGIGVAYANYNSFHLIPVFAHGTINFSKGNVIPFIQGKIGYAFGGKTGAVDYNLINDGGETPSTLVLSEAKGSLFVQPAIGLKFRVKENHKLTVAVTVDGLLMKIATAADPTTFMYPKNGTMGLKIGYEF